MNYRSIYDKIIEFRRKNPVDEYCESHHIIPKCLGGDNSNENIVKLTAREHYISHLILCKLYPSHRGLAYAAIKMTLKAPRQNRSKNKLYEWVKIKFSDLQSEAQKGANNNQFNTIWINQIGTTNNKKIKLTENIPDGWVKGRVLKSNTRTSLDKKLKQVKKEKKQDALKTKWLEFFHEWKETDKSINSFMKEKGYHGASTATKMWKKFNLYEFKKHKKHDCLSTRL